MTTLLLYLQSTPGPVNAEAWEIAKGVMLTLVTLGVAYLIRGIRTLEFEVRDIKADVKTAQSGELALKKGAHEHDSRLDVLEIWKAKLDTVSEIERELWEGDERRMRLRRLRDRMMTDTPLSPEDLL